MAVPDPPSGVTDQKRKPAGRGFAKGGNGFGRTALQREAHYRLEARLLAQGLGVNEIAVKAGLSKAQVSKDIAYLRSVWKARNEADLAFERARQLAEVAHIKQEALEAWERSKQPTKVSRLIQRKGAPKCTLHAVGRGIQAPFGKARDAPSIHTGTISTSRNARAR